MPTRQRLLLLAFVLGASAVLAIRAESYWVGDYPAEAGPAIDALIHGRLGDILDSRPLMGPVSLILRAPFAALSRLTGGGGPIDAYENAYRFGVFPCLAVAGAVGVHVAGRMWRAGVRPLLCWAVPAVVLLNPVTIRAVTYGHPEEVLGAALVVLAMLLALERRSGWAALVLLLAVGTKQWALLAVPAVAVVAERERFGRALLIAAGAAIVVVALLLVVDADAVYDANRVLFDLRGDNTRPASIWWLAMPDDVPDPVLRSLPDWLALSAHPLILASAIALPLALAERVRAAPWERALPLLALVLLLRCMLDPVDNSYYHVPFFLALLTADALTRAYLPTLITFAALIAIMDLADWPVLQAIAYVLWSVPLTAHLTARAAGYDLGAALRSRGVRGPAAARTPRPS